MPPPARDPSLRACPRPHPDVVKATDIKYDAFGKIFTTDGGLVVRGDTGFDLGDKGGKFCFLGFGFQYDKNDAGAWSGLHMFVPLVTIDCCWEDKLKPPGA